MNDTADESISNGLIATGQRIILEMMKGGGEFILATDVGSVSLERQYGNEVIRECLSFVCRKTNKQKTTFVRPPKRPVLKSYVAFICFGD